MLRISARLSDGTLSMVSENGTHIIIGKDKRYESQHNDKEQLCIGYAQVL